MITAFLLALIAGDALPAVRAHADLSHVFLASDYPPTAMIHAETGAVGFALDVQANGHVGACRVTTTSGFADLDAATCQVLTTRAVFAPARDSAGAAVADQYSGRITWALPEPPTGARARTNLAAYITDNDYPAAAVQTGQQGVVGFELDVSPDGHAAACRVIQSSAGNLLNAKTCQVMIQRARFQPARDAAGHPAPDTIRARVRWVLPSNGSDRLR